MDADEPQLDTKVLAALPPGSQVISVDAHGASSWSTAFKVEIEVDGEEKEYFLKIIHQPDHAEMALGEFESQKAMAEYMPDNVSTPLAYGTLERNPDNSFFLTPFRDLSDKPPGPDQVVKVLEKLHVPSTSPNGKFGFHVATFNGVVRLQNEWCDTWEEWFARQLRSDLEWLRGRRGTDTEFDEVCEEFFQLVIPRLLRPLDIKPTLVHGDVWSGNAQVDRDTNELILFDSCCCYGHNELDLAMMREPHYKFNHEYKERYAETIHPSEPKGDFDDRNAIYAMRDNIINAGLWDHRAHLRDHVKSEMSRLIAKHPKGYEGHVAGLEAGVTNGASAKLGQTFSVIPHQVHCDTTGLGGL